METTHVHPPPPIFTRFFRLFSLDSGKRKHKRPARYTRLNVEQLESRDVPTSAPVIENLVLNTTTPLTNDIIGPMFTVTDADDDLISFDYVWRVNGNITRTMTTNFPYDPYQLYYAGYGDKGQTVEVSVTPWDANDRGLPVTVSAVVANSAPVIDTGNLSATQSFTGDTIALLFYATDPDGDPIDFTAIDLPPGLSMDSTGLITGTISSSADTTNPYSVTLTADGGDATVTQTLSWAIAPPYIVVVQGDQHSIAGETLALSLYSWTPAGHTLTYAISGQPAGVDIDSETGEITGTIAYGEESTTPYAVTITATDSAGGVVESATFDWYVNAPEILAFDIGDLESIVGATVEVTIEAWSTEGGTVTFSQVGLPPGLDIDDETGVITGTIDSAADLSSPYAVTITATNAAAGISTNITFSWAVRQLVLRSPEDQANLIGDMVSLPLVAPYAGNGTLIFSMTGNPDGLFINTTNGEIYGTIASTAAATTPYVLTVTVTDGTLTQSMTFNWDVKELFVNDPGDQFSLDEDTPTLTFAVTQLAGHNITYVATDLPTGLSVNEDTGAIEGTIDETAHDDGPFNVTVTATDTTINVTASKTFTWVVDAPGFVTSPGPPPVFPNPRRLEDLLETVRQLSREVLLRQRLLNSGNSAVNASIADVVRYFSDYVNADNFAARFLAQTNLEISVGLLFLYIDARQDAARRLFETIQDYNNAVRRYEAYRDLQL